MRGGATLSVTDLRGALRHRVDCTVRAEHLARDSELSLAVRNISPSGLMIADNPGLSRGERLILRLPKVGRVEGYCIWTVDSRAGFQFERLLRPAEFAALLDELQPGVRLRR